MPLNKASIDLIRERIRAEAEAAEAGEEAEAAAQAERPRDTVVSAARGWLERLRERPSHSGEEAEAAAPAAQTSIERLRERIANFGDRTEPAAPDNRPLFKAVVRTWGWIEAVAARTELIIERLSAPRPRAEPAAPVERPRLAAAAGGSGWRMLAVAAACTIPALAVIAAVLVDPWAGKGCPDAVDQGADCSHYGVAGRTYSALALVNVVKELENHQWAAARADLKPILRVRPNFALAIGDRGEAEAGLGDPAAARVDYDRALTLAPYYLPTRARRGQLYQSLGKTKEAAADFAFIYHAAPSTHKWAEVVAIVRQIDHSTPSPKDHEHPKSKHRRRPTVDAAPPPEPSPPPSEQSPQTSPSGEN
jgi:tetratricopeptide (TPR) repeat protein